MLSLFTNQRLAPVLPLAHEIKQSKSDLKPLMSTKTLRQARDRPSLLSPNSRLTHSREFIKSLGFNSNLVASTVTQVKDRSKHPSKAPSKAANDCSSEGGNKHANGKQPSARLERIELKLPSQQAEEQAAAETAAAETLKQLKVEHKQELLKLAGTIDAMNTEMLVYKTTISSLKEDLARKAKGDRVRESTENNAGEMVL